MTFYSKIYGGLGNQMFQYALGKSISFSNNSDFKIDTYAMNYYGLRDLGIDKFNISVDIATIEEVRKFHFNKYLDWIAKKINQFGIKINSKFYEKKEFSFDIKVFESDCNYFQGYWQSHKYLENIKEILIREFTLREGLNEENNKIYKEIVASNSISLHIRRGDYLSNAKNNKLYNVVGLDYYRNAIDYMKSNITNPHFFVFSDDLPWAKDNLNLVNVTYVDVNSNKTPECDMVLMSNCKHNIIANSTFSWWGAWLNQNENKVVIAPKKWMSTIDNLDDLYPKNWIRL